MEAIVEGKKRRKERQTGQIHRQRANPEYHGKKVNKEEGNYDKHHTFVPILSFLFFHWLGLDFLLIGFFSFARILVTASAIAGFWRR